RGGWRFRPHRQAAGPGCADDGARTESVRLEPAGAVLHAAPIAGTDVARLYRRARRRGGAGAGSIGRARLPAVRFAPRAARSRRGAARRAMAALRARRDAARATAAALPRIRQ